MGPPRAIDPHPCDPRGQPADEPADPLAPGIRRLFADLRHAGDLAVSLSTTEPPTEQVLTGEAGQVEQGARVRVQLRLSARDRRILEARYRAYGCPYLLATCEWLARRLEECPVPEPRPLEPAAIVGRAVDWAEALGIPPGRLGRLFVIEDALRAALAGN